MSLCAAGAFALLASTPIARAQPLPQASPFLPPAGAAAAGPADAKYQLGGMITQGKEVLVNITRASDKQSFWVPVGGTVNEVTVHSYDSALDQASVSANGQRFTLALRKPSVLTGAAAVTGTGSSNAPAAVISPPLPPPSGPPEVQEREARMLVTDLLEIGQQQRKAYEEAQRAAAAAAAAKQK